MRGHYAAESFIDFSQEANRSTMLEALAKVESELGKNYPIVVNGERRETGSWITSPPATRSPARPPAAAPGARPGRHRG